MPKLRLSSLLFVLTTVACSGNIGLDGSPAASAAAAKASMHAPVPNTAYTLGSVNSGLVLDAQGGGLTHGDGVLQNAANHTVSQEWMLVANNDAFYVVNQAAGLCLNVTDQSTETGAPLQLWDCNGGTSELWNVEQISQGIFQIVNVNSAQVIDVADVSKQPGHIVHQWQYVGGLNQQWTFSAVGGTASGSGNLAPVASVSAGIPYVVQFTANSQVIEVASASTNDGAQVVQAALSGTSGSAAQQWVLQPAATGSGYYNVVNVATGKCLDVYQHNMQQWTCNGGPTESWSVVSQGGNVFYLQASGDGSFANAVGTSPLTQIVTSSAGSEASLKFLSTVSGGTTGGTGGGTTGGTSTSTSVTLSNAVVYQVYTNIFSGTGNFAGVTAHLQALHAMGVNVVYLMPITPNSGPVSGHGFVGPLGSPYSVEDYTVLNPNFGTAADFRTLLSTAHGLGMKVIIDQVLNQTGWSNPLLAAHPEFYAHDSSGNVEAGAYWSSSPYTDVAQLDYYGSGASALQSYMTNMLTTWLRTYPIDGFRFDAASYYMNPVANRPNIPVAFWKSVGASLRAINPNVILLGEELTPNLALAPFNLDYGWGFYSALQPAFANGSGAANVRSQYASQQAPAYPATMTHLNIIQNWDKEADYKAFGGFPQARAAAVVNALLPGVPMMFNGEEVGNTNFGGGTGNNTMMAINWTGTNAQVMTTFYTSLLGLRAKYTALQSGSLTWLSNKTGDDRVLSFERSDASGTFVVVVNLSSDSISGTLSNAPSAKGWTDVSPASSPGGNSHAAVPSYNLQANDYAVFIAQ